MDRNVACRYADNHILHENPGHKLLQGWQNLSHGRGLRHAAKDGPLFQDKYKFSTNFV